MKKTNLLIGIAVAAMSLSLSGCMLANGFTGNNIIDYTSKKNNTTKAEATASINKTNDTSEFIRGMRTFDRNKKGITAKIVMENADTKPGVMGIVFDMKKNSDKSLNFVLLGVGYYNNQPRTYIAVYKNVKEENFDKEDFGTGLTGSTTTRSDVLDFYYLPTSLVSGTTLNVVVEIQALTEAEDSTNAYAVRYYEANDADLTTYVGLSDKAKGEASTVRNTNKKEVLIPRASVPNSTGTVQEQMGFYANVYSNRTLKGEWQVADIDHQANVAKTAADDDDSFIKLNF